MSQIENFYQHIKGGADKRSYPNEHLLNIILPARILLLGPSGSGKTNLLLNLIKQIGVFDKIVLLAKDLEEPLYKYMAEIFAKIEKKLRIQMLLAINDINDMPSVDDFDPKENNLLIIDDMICEKPADLAKIEAFWIRGRKKHVTQVFISQSYYAVPKKIRQNTQYIMIKKVDTPKDLKTVLREYALGGITIEQLKAMYEYAIQSGKNPHLSFFMIDTVTGDSRLRFRACFDPIA